MPRRPGMSAFEMIFDIFKTFFSTIFRAFGRILGMAIAAGVIGAIGGGAVSVIYSYPFIPWVIGGFVGCAILALVLMMFVASDL